LEQKIAKPLSPILTPLRSPAGENRGPTALHDTTIRWFFRCVVAALALAEIVLGRNTFGPDSRSYLEIARAILRHDWPMTINAYWSALYPWLLAAVLGIFKPSLRWEIPVAHALSFPIFLVCIAAFEFFWISLLRLREFATVRLALTSPSIPPAHMWMLGYSLFIWLTLGNLVLLINPDLCVTTIALLAAALLLRIELTAGARPYLYVWLGICLGLGYLAKAILFPMAFVFLALMILVSGRPFRRQLWSLALALLMFSVVALPEIALLSHSKGRLTFSDTGKLNFAWYNYNIPDVNWQGEPPGSGTPAHPTRKLYAHPAVYEFNGPLRSNYPPWFDPSYWNEGLSPKFKFGVVASHALHGGFQLALILIHPTAWLIGILLILLGCDLKETFKGIAVYWYLIVTSVVAMALYCLTLVQGRFLPPWQLLLWGAVLAAVRLKPQIRQRPATAFLYAWLPVLMSLALVGAIAHMVYGASRHGFYNDASAEYVTAEGLKQMGLQRGEKVAAIGFDSDAHWAYLARLNVVAEINSDDTCLFWSESPAVQTNILRKFAQAGAIAVIANTGGGIRTTSRDVALDLAGCSRPSQGWRKIEASPNYAYFLSQPAEVKTNSLEHSEK
jgi:hypothetical protein